LTLSKVLLAISITPPDGLVTNPMTPAPRPLKNPPTPASLAPETGLVITPVTPLKTFCKIQK